MKTAGAPAGILSVVNLPDSDLLRALAHGERPSFSQARSRRTRMFLETVEPILTEGEFIDGLLATGGLRASEWRTRERGSVTLVENPTDAPRTGAVFPGLPSISLAPGEIFPWVHDLPLGPSDRYLAAYAGLVKCDAFLLAAHIRPDPFVGARVFVWGEIGSTRPVVLFGGGRGEECAVTFTEIPQVFAVAESQVVALPPDLAEAAHIPAVPQASLDPTTLGSDWLLWPGGAPERVSDWPEIDTPLSGWLAATVSVPAATGARLELASGEIGALWVNGVPSPPADVTLQAGENTLLIRADSPLESPLLVPDGACYLIELSQWRRRAAAED